MRKLSLALAVCLLAAAPAHAAFIFNQVVTVAGGGIVAPNANYGCPAGSADCLASKNFDLVGTGPVTPFPGGSSFIMEGFQNGSGPEVAWINFDVASVTFAPSGGGASQVFTNVHYEAFVPVLPLSFIQSAPGTGTVTGLLNGTPFSTTAAVYNLVCATVNGVGQCGVAFGPQLFTAGGENWLHTFNVNVVPGPEPAGVSLVLLGLVGVGGLALRRRA